MAHRVEALVFCLGVQSLIPKIHMVGRDLTTIMCYLTSTHTHPQRNKYTNL